MRKSPESQQITVLFRGVCHSTKSPIVNRQIIRSKKIICFFLEHNIVGTHSVITSCTINEVIE